MERGHQLAKYLSCCAASQCAEAHICSRRVAKAGAAACKHCGGAGGGSEWAKAFADALCDVFDCPSDVRQEALGLVLAAVAFASPCEDDASIERAGGRDSASGVDGNGERSRAEQGIGLGGGDGDEDSGLGSSWESVSTFACLDVDARSNDQGGSDAHDGTAFSDDDDDESVRRGVWFPPPGLEAPESNASESSTSRSPPVVAFESTAVDGDSSQAALWRDDRDSGRVVGRAGKKTAVSGVAAGTPATASSSLRDRLELWRRSSSTSFGMAAAKLQILGAGSGDGYGVEETRSEDGWELRKGTEGSAEGGVGSEFVVLVSREATVRELATRVRGFPTEWLEEALSLVVRKQVQGAVYDARARAALKRAVRLLDGRVSWRQVALAEQELAALAYDREGRIQDGDQNKEAPVSGRYWKVGLAAAGGGVLLFLSGGVAAPSVTASLSSVGFAAANSVSSVAPTLGAWLGYTSASAAAAATTGAAGAGSVGTFSAAAGAAGAGVAGYKMSRRTAGVQEFHFLPLHSKWPLDTPESMFEGTSEPGLPVFICVPGWHEPGHDPRHVWGGIGAANAAAPTTTFGEDGLPTAYPVAPSASGAGAGEEAAAAAAGAEGVAAVRGVSIPGEGVGPIAAATVVGELQSTMGVEASAASSSWSSTAGNIGAHGVASCRGSESPASAPVMTPPVRARPPKTVCGAARLLGTLAENGSASKGPRHRSVDAGHRHDDRTIDLDSSSIALPLRQRNASAESGGAQAPMVASFVDLGAREAGRCDESSCGRGDGIGLVAGAESCPRIGGGAHGGDPVFVSPQQQREGKARTNVGKIRRIVEEELDDSWETLPLHAWWRDFVSGGEEHVLVWERGPLTELHAAIRDLAWKSASRRAVNEALKRSMLAPVVAAAALPLALLDAASGLDDPWGVVRTRALEAGRLLAAVLLSRPVGSRPVTLLGYSMGAKVVFNCLEALAAAPGERGLGIVENAVMLGTPVGTKRGRWKRARSAVAGRLINGYSSRDWLLALVYRSKSWSVGVAGTSRVEGCGVENVDLSALVTWHLSYSRILPTVMAMLRLEE